jgi:DNA segregation ATPase FtsK/SpoIIIE, S-DNA-T family
MRKQELEAQADQIELVLHQYKAQAQVTGGTVTPRWIQFLLQTAPGVKVNRIEALSREIALALGVIDARVTLQHGQVRIDVPRRDPQPVKLLELMDHLTASRLPFGTAVLGVADDGAPLLVRLPSPDVGHILIAGTTGSGKTALLQSIIASLAIAHRRSQLQLVLIDPKGYSFAALHDLPHLLHPIVSQPDRALDLLGEMTALLDRRATTARPEPCVVIVIDELADLAQSFGSRSGGGAQVIDRVGRLVQRGREANIHVIAATQRPSSAIIGPLVKANFPVRLVGRVVSPEDARVAAGIGGTGAERLSGRGDFLAISNLGTLRFQAAYASRAELEQLAQRVRS